MIANFTLMHLLIFSVSIAKVDCTKETKICKADPDVKGYPTLKLYVGGEAIKYSGPRNIEAFKAFIQDNGEKKPEVRQR